MKELNYFIIDGAIGWNQDWFKEWWMNKGGCAAVTACDLCLYLAREIITGESGYIRVRSEKGVGSVFSVFLPLDTKS